MASVLLRFLITKHKTLEFTRIRKIKDTPRARRVVCGKGTGCCTGPRTGTESGMGMKTVAGVGV